MRSMTARSEEELLLNSFISPELAREVGLAARIQQYREQDGLGYKSSLKKDHVKRILTANLTAGVERFARISRSIGVENCQPLLDRRVVEFCVSLPWRQKCRDGWSKFALRKVAERYLPTEVAWRPGWEEIAGKFALAYRQLSFRAEARRVLDYGETLGDYIDWPRVKAHFEQQLREDSEYSRDGFRIVALVDWHKRVTSAR
jgi:asparagine synthase (glutamine-hydrolysing)